MTYLQRTLISLVSVAAIAALSGCSAGGDTPDGSARGGGSNAGTGGTGAASGGNGGSSGAVSGGGAAGVAAGGAASGGTSGGGGNAGASGSGGAATGSGPCAAPGLVFCDDFEAGTVGSMPTTAPWMMRSPRCGDPNAVVPSVSNTSAHSGSQSLGSARIPYDQCSLMADVGTLDDFWVRSWVQYGPGATFNEHEVTILELAVDAAKDDPEIRIGTRNKESCPQIGAELNVSGAEGGEQTGCTTFQFQAEQWYCVEVHVTQASGALTAELYVDGADQSYTVHGKPVETITAKMQEFPMRYLKVAQQAYSSGNGAWSVNYDDVAVGTQRIGCGQ